MARCAGIKRDGGRCAVIVKGAQTYCYQTEGRPVVWGLEVG
jgi:hypothetical protein